ncbi:MAG: hypothetical protein WCV80_00665 [Candidatus Paceibacterota bacterium]|jgi:hypothetical protein
MSLHPNGVTLDQRHKKGVIMIALVTLFEFVLSTIFVISLASFTLFPNQVNAVAGVSKKLSYQGRLTDTSGNALGGAGTTYYFCLSIYDAAAAGAKLWPAGTPTSAGATVTNGVFNLGIGEADSLATYDFSANDTEYLNIEVAASNGTCGGAPFETLAPRQRLDAVAYARVAENLSGGNARVGTGAGVTSGSQKYVHLDVMSQAAVEATGDACPTGSVNGSVWYNSSRTRALVCENNVIRVLSGIEGVKEQSVAAGSEIKWGVVNISGSNNITVSQTGSTIQLSVPSQTVQTQNLHNMTISGNTAGVLAAISSGTLTLAGGNNITLSQNGNAVTISAGAGGGGAALQGSGTYSQNTGTIQFANSNGVTFGLSNNGVMTASVAAGGGGAGLTRNMYDNLGGRDFITNITNITAISQRPVFTPFYLDADIQVDRIALEMSRATSGSNLFTVQMALYTQVNSTQISRLASLQNVFSNTATASISGVRQFHLSGFEAAGTSLSPGVYIMGAYFSAAATASMNYSIRGGITVAPPVGIINVGSNVVYTATSQLSTNHLRMFQGRYTNTTNALPASVAASQIQGWTSAVPFYFRIQNT